MYSKKEIKLIIAACNSFLEIAHVCSVFVDLYPIDLDVSNEDLYRNVKLQKYVRNKSLTRIKQIRHENL